MKALEKLTVRELEAAWWLWGYVVNLTAERYKGAKPRELSPQQYAVILRDALAGIGDTK
jgi:hypothetical protein